MLTLSQWLLAWRAAAGIVVAASIAQYCPDIRHATQANYRRADGFPADAQS